MVDEGLLAFWPDPLDRGPHGLSRPHAWHLPASALQEVLDAVKAGEMSVPIARVFHGLDQVPDAHRALDSHAVPGKNVVVLG